MEKTDKCEWFQVNLDTINTELFSQSREDFAQENIRLLILEALSQAKNNPKYARPFKTLIPQYDGKSKTVLEVKILASRLGDHVANWVEQALEWAQKLSNGVSWEALCNNADTLEWHRLIYWKCGNMRLVGGSTIFGSYSAPTHVVNYDFGFHDYVSHSVPLVIVYD